MHSAGSPYNHAMYSPLLSMLLPFLPVQMHGTGTALGDPIEVGALATALRGQPSATHYPPLVPMASKSWYGHAEPAAGFVGMAHAVAAASHRAVLAQLHLRTLNPHVGDAVSAHGGGGDDGRRAAVAAPWLLPRATGAAPDQDRTASVLTTVSAFAFQVHTLPAGDNIVIDGCLYHRLIVVRR